MFPVMQKLKTKDNYWKRRQAGVSKRTSNKKTL